MTGMSPEAVLVQVLVELDVADASTTSDDEVTQLQLPANIESDTNTAPGVISLYRRT